MAETQWQAFKNNIASGGVEKLLTRSTYEAEVVDARPFRKEGEIRRGIFVEWVILKGPEKDTFASTYINVPESGNRRAGFWYAKKMAGFGDLSAVYESMPDELEAALEVLCAALVGKKCLALIGPGNGEYSNRNNLEETKPLGEQNGKIEAIEELEESEEVPAESEDIGNPGF